jgi:hypothetical protein
MQGKTGRPTSAVPSSPDPATTHRLTRPPLSFPRPGVARTGPEDRREPLTPDNVTGSKTGQRKGDKMSGGGAPAGSTYPRPSSMDVVTSVVAIRVLLVNGGTRPALCGLNPKWNLLAQRISALIAPCASHDGGYATACAAQVVPPHYLRVICGRSGDFPYFAPPNTVAQDVDVARPCHRSRSGGPVLKWLKTKPVIPLQASLPPRSRLVPASLPPRSR